MGHRFAHNGVLETVILVLMAGDAGLAAYVIAIAGRRWRGFGLFLASPRIRSILRWRARVQAHSKAKRSQKQ
jgi:hypothetical protein